jgi:hypothetical protein
MSKSGTQGGGTSRDVMNYAEPTGRAGSTNGPGLGGSRYRQGTQGPTPCDNDESGSPGLGGDKHGTGTNRSG